MNPFRIGEYLIRPDLNRITHGEVVHQVEPRLIQILITLARQPGRVVSRSTLMDEIWGDVIVSDETITVAVSELRRLLKDDPRKPRYIETIRKGGYRLIMPIAPEEAASPVPPAPPPAQNDTTETSAPAADSTDTASDRPGRFPVWRRAAMFVSLMLLLIVFGFIVRNLQTQPSVPPAFLAGTPFTSYPGAELFPAISSDGNRVAFAWQEPGNDNRDIYIKQRNTEHALRLTDNPANETHPVWSPDGSQLAYVREATDTKEGGIYLVPSIGGVPRRLIHQKGTVFGLSWSPGGEWIVYAAADTVGGLAGLHKLSIATHESTQLTHPHENYTCDFEPRISPDGERIAFVRSQGPSFKQDIHIMPFAGGPVRPVTHSQRRVRGLTWLADSESIVFSASPLAALNLWRLDLKKGKVTWLPTKGIKAGRPCAPVSGNLLIYEDLSFNYDIWQLDLDTYDGSAETVTRLVASTRSDYGSRMSPDGSRFVFVSTRSGNHELWMCDRAGKELTQLTHYDGVYVTPARWSGDGQRIVYNAYPDGMAEIHTLDVESLELRCLLKDEGHLILYTWVHQGDWIYYAKDDDGESNLLWKMKPDGSDQQLHGKVIYSVAGTSPDEKYVYCYRRDDWSVWRYRGDGESGNLSDHEQDMELVVPGETMITWDTWATGEDGIYFTRFTSSGSVLGRFDFATKRIEYLGQLPGAEIVGLMLAPDKRTLHFSCTERVESDLILVDGFN